MRTLLWGFVCRISRFCLLAGLAGLLVATSISASAQTSPKTPQVAPLNPAFVAYMKGTRSATNSTPLVVDGHRLGHLPSPVDFTYLTRQAGPAQRFRLGLPGRFDLREWGRVSTVKNQGSCADCWAFSAYGSLESSLLPDELWDFSENNLNNLHGFDWAPCTGGNSAISMAYLARWSGPVSASDDPDMPWTQTPSPSDLPEQKHVQDVIILPPRADSLDNANLKTAIMVYGAVDVALAIYPESQAQFWNQGNGAYYYDGSPICWYDGAAACGTDHQVALIGWDDNFPAANFATQPPGNGAFLAKNSWDATWGLKGFFWISYYDYTTAREAQFVFHEAEPNSNYVNAYQYDQYGWLAGVGYGSTTAWGANIFTAESDELLEAVSTYAASNNTTAVVSVYTAVSGDPSTGTLKASVPAKFDFAGYHTVEVPRLALHAGQRFAVVVGLNTPTNNYPIPFQRRIPGYASQATGAPGRSYISWNGQQWWDITNLDSTATVALKAFTIPMHAPIASLSRPYLNFALKDLHSESLQNLMVMNTGTAALHLKSVRITGPGASSFMVRQNNCGLSLGVNLRCSMTVVYRPKSAELPAATLVVEDDSAAGQTQSVPLRVYRKMQ